MTTEISQSEDREDPSLPVVLIFAGPNGSGKSTITNAIVHDPDQFDGEYINADDIAKSLESEIADYQTRNIRAAEIAEERRLSALHEGKTFAFETVMSTPEKVALMTQAKALGYSVQLIFVSTNDPEKNVARVATRVTAGGHAVEPDAIRRRYAQTMDLLAGAFEKADYATVFDNSEREPRAVVTKEGGNLGFPGGSDLPTWVQKNLMGPYTARLQSLAYLAGLHPVGSSSRQAEAANGKEYAGQVLGVTPYHILQDVDGELLVHDRQLTATAAVTVGEAHIIAYRYLKGKIVCGDADTPVARSTKPRL